MTNMPSNSYSGPFQTLSENEQLLCDRLKNHVLMLAEKIGERNIWQYSQLETSANYIEKVLGDLNYKVTRQEFKVEGRAVRNIEAELVGTSLPKEVVIIGAHYDSVLGSPGANDNASGVAGVLEIARLIAREKLSRTIRIVAFVNEEPPFFQTEDMGSRVYTSRLRKHKEQIVAMLAIETIGYYSDVEGSQHYPFPFSFFYPNTANFIAFVSNISSRHLVRRVIETFRKHTAFPSEGLSAPSFLTGIDWSDHWSFWKEGYPAIMVTDTALFRYKHYHTQEDTSDKIDYPRTARVVTGIAQVLRFLAQRDL
jgi:Zn-dependent M28 family amino/carboxypeptidase